jgi:hypothetical protein
MKVNWVDHLINFLSVILGVSLAFFISDYSLKSQLNEEYQFYIDSIIEEMEGDVETYEDYQIPDNRQKVEDMQKALTILVTGENIDSLAYYLGSGSTNVNNYSPQNLAYNSLQTAGKLDMISNLELRNDLMLYQALSLEVEYQGKYQLEFFMDKMITYYLENPDLMEDPSKLVGKTSFITLLSIYASFVENKVDKYEETMVAAKAILPKLKRELRQEFNEVTRNDSIQ